MNFNYVKEIFSKDDIKKKQANVEEYKKYIDALKRLKETRDYDLVFNEYVDLVKYTIFHQMWELAKSGAEEGYDNLIKELKRVGTMKKIVNDISILEEDLNLEEVEIDKWKQLENKFKE